MAIEIREEPMTAIEDMVRVPSRFEVRSVLEVAPRDGGLGGLVLVERAVAAPYIKDYDQLESPLDVVGTFDLSRCGLIGAHADGRRIGGALIAFDTPGVDMLRARRDLAVLWDIRVAPGCQRASVGSRLFRAVEAWAVARGCRWLKIETQNINVPACRFYARQGCVLGGIDRFAYPDLPEEAQLLWYKTLM